MDDEPSKWFVEERSLSTFRVFMWHLQGAFGGGMPFAASGPAEKRLAKVLEKDWYFAGEVNGMRAYNRDKQALCFVKWQDFFDKTAAWRVFAGACDKKGLDVISNDLDVDWD